MNKFTVTKDIIATLPKGRKERALALLTKLIFLDNQLEKLQKEIKKKGLIEEYQNGANQKGFKKSSEATVYAEFFKQYNAGVKQLESMIGNNEIQAGNSLMEFVRRGKDLSTYEDDQDE